MNTKYIELSQALQVLDSCSCWWAHERMEHIPAADVRPVVRGSWEEHGEPDAWGKYELWYYSCTRCGAVGVPEFNFCPNCGADMRAEEGE